jgi:hypothetical protein
LNVAKIRKIGKKNYIRHSELHHLALGLTSSLMIESFTKKYMYNYTVMYMENVGKPCFVNSYSYNG